MEPIFVHWLLCIIVSKPAGFNLNRMKLCEISGSKIDSESDKVVVTLRVMLGF